MCRAEKDSLTQTKVPWLMTKINSSKSLLRRHTMPHNLHSCHFVEQHSGWVKGPSSFFLWLISLGRRGVVIKHDQWEGPAGSWARILGVSQPQFYPFHTAVPSPTWTIPCWQKNVFCTFAWFTILCQPEPYCTGSDISSSHGLFQLGSINYGCVEPVPRPVQYSSA